MITVKCPVCHTEVEINIAKAVDEEGEVFYCKNCGQVFRYTDK